ncbi:MAG: hypothetical protein EAZ91_03535 [Cytophagales bacterium]|nr:MAG: hypothetical protein EAZ91_03535 [Cytophagales bacterium]
MYRLTRYFLLFFAIGLLTQCKSDTDTPGLVTPASQTELLVANTWRVDRVTDTGGKAINTAQLGLETAALLFLDFQFTNANIVRAIDRTTKQIRNAGDWTLTADNTAINVKVTGFNGVFKLVELTKNSLILQQEGVQVNGVKQAANLVFVPSI